MDKESATKIVRRYLMSMEKKINASGSALPGYDPSFKTHLLLLEQDTIEYDFGWLFFYNSKEFIDTGDEDYALAGNAPLIVERKTGILYVTGTAYPIEYYVQEFIRGNRTAADFDKE